MSLHSRLLVTPHDEFAQSYGCTISAGLSTASEQAIFTRRVTPASTSLYRQPDALNPGHPTSPFRVPCGVVRSCTLPTYGLEMNTMLPH